MPWGRQKTEIGTVVSDKMDKTVVVAVVRDKRHRLYRKRLRVTRRFKAHNENNEARIGDTVRIVETRPLSKEKRWRVVEIIQRGEVAEVAPTEIGRAIEMARHEERLRQAEERQVQQETAAAAAPPVETPIASETAGAPDESAANEESTAETEEPAAEREEPAEDAPPAVDEEREA